jgi:malonate transporter
MIEAFSAVVPVFLLIGLGVCLDIFRALPENAHQTMSLYVLNVALPLLLFQIMATAPLESFAHPQFWLGVIAAQFLIYGACYAADRILARHNSATATVTALGGCFCNAAFVGIPVITSALPGNAEALFVAGLFTITPNLLFVVGQVQLAAHDPSRSMPQGRKAVLLHVLRYSLLYNAVFWGMAGGVLVSALGLGLWDPLNRAAELVGHTAAPCMLVTLGLTLRERLAVVLRHAGRHAAPDGPAGLQAGGAAPGVLGHPGRAGCGRPVAGGFGHYGRFRLGPGGPRAGRRASCRAGRSDPDGLGLQRLEPVLTELLHLDDASAGPYLMRPAWLPAVLWRQGQRGLPPPAGPACGQGCRKAFGISCPTTQRPVDTGLFQ